jgi:serine/threonine-protein kinase
MAKKPEDRYQTAREVLRELTRLADEMRVSIPQGMLAPVDSSATVEPIPTARAAMPLARAEVTGRMVGWWRRPAGRFTPVVLSVLLALIAGCVIGWYRNRPIAPPPVDDDAAMARALFSSKEKEKQLQKLVKENYKPHGPLDLKLLSGLNAAVDLGLLYLEERQIDQADAFFKELCTGGEKGCPGRLLSSLGRAMVLAFRDDPAESNRLFIAITTEFDKLEKLDRQVIANPPGKGDKKLMREWQAHKEDIDIYNLVWKRAAPAASLREMAARALQRNFENDAKGFPPRLESFRHPPRPVVKGPGAS